MLKKFLIIIITTFALTLNVGASSDGELVLKKNNPAEINDCFEGFNRASFALNQGLDKIVFKPVASVYKKLPSPVKSGVSNSLNNLSNVVTIPNNLLQGEFTKAGINTGRFVINTTVGILGIIDVAEYLGFSEYEKEDYGQTFGKWGIGPGCYIVLPVLGPSTIRDTVGSFVNVMGGDPWYNASINGNNEYLNENIFLTSKILSGVEFRANNLESFDNLEKNSMDFYASLKSLYMQDRQLKIDNITRGNIQVIYNDEGDWEEIDTK